MVAAHATEDIARHLDVWRVVGNVFGRHDGSSTCSWVRHTGLRSTSDPCSQLDQFASHVMKRGRGMETFAEKKGGAAKCVVGRIEMSYYPYTPWSRDSETKEEEEEEEERGRGGWFKNAFKNPWKWKRDGGNKAKSTQGEQWKRGRPFGAFPPIMSQLAWGLERRNSDPLAKRGGAALREPATVDASEDFDLPQYEGQRRPRLDSVFAIHDPPPAPPRPLGGAVGRASSFNERESAFAARERVRRETKEEVDGGEGHVRGVSTDSTGSEERTLERRKRRMGVVRKIPQLPQRSNRFDWNEVHSVPEVSHRRRRPTPAPTTQFERRGFEIYKPHRAHPPRGALGHNFVPPPWGSPPDSLPTLSEESETGDIKGFDDFKLY